MSYQIQYEPDKNRKYPTKMAKKSNLTGGIMITVILIVCLSIGLRTGWLIPGDPDVTKAAFSEMVDMLKRGEPVYDSVTVFCTEVLEHGQQISD